MDYAERQKQSKTIPADLVRDLWSEIKSARDEASYRATAERDREERLNNLLRRMGDAGMKDHLPTIDEVRAAWRGCEE